MTQPTEADIRAACEEAEVEDTDFTVSILLNPPPRITPLGHALLALARRIEAEREAVPVAWMHTQEDRRFVSFKPVARDDDPLFSFTETPLYAHPPKEPTT